LSLPAAVTQRTGQHLPEPRQNKTTHSYESLSLDPIIAQTLKELTSDFLFFLCRFPYKELYRRHTEE
jgi:hypothetical protein